MPPRLPAMTAAVLLRALGKNGFEVVCRSGSHVVLRHPDGRRTTVPVHSGRDLGKGLLARILRDAGLTRDELLR